MTTGFDDQVLAAVRELGEASVHELTVQVPTLVAGAVRPTAPYDVVLALRRLRAAQEVVLCSCQPDLWRAHRREVDMAAFEDLVR